MIKIYYYYINILTADLNGSNYIWVINYFIAYYDATYVRCLTLVQCWIYESLGLAKWSTNLSAGTVLAKIC